MEVGRDDHVAVWTGRQLLVWGGYTVQGGVAVAPRRGVVFDQASNRWSPMPTSSLRGRTEATAVWTGGSLIILGGWEIGGDPEQFSDGAAYTP
jgi:N-acetylneuraminic acid mutarotase